MDTRRHLELLLSSRGADAPEIAIVETVATGGQGVEILP